MFLKILLTVNPLGILHLHLMINIIRFLIYIEAALKTPQELYLDK